MAQPIEEEMIKQKNTASDLVDEEDDIAHIAELYARQKRAGESKRNARLEFLSAHLRHVHAGDRLSP